MTFTVKDFKRDVQNRGLFRTDMQEIWTANIVDDETGDWIGVSRWDDEEYWVADCAFRANGYPLFSNGTGSRCTTMRTASPEVSEVLNNMTEAMLDEEFSASVNSYLEWEQESYGREAEEGMLGRPLLPNEY